MWKSYIKIAWRSLLKNRLYSFVNLTGLSVGLVSCILIGAYVANEWSYDRFQRKGDKIARVVMEYSIGGTVEKVAVCGTKAGPQFRRTFPAVEDFVRMMKFPAIVSYNGAVYDEKRFLYADSSFFRLFSFRLLRGDPMRSLGAPNQLVLTESMARKYFGSEDPMGHVLKINNSKQFTVTGVVSDCPENSQFHFDFIASFTSLDAAANEEWWTANYTTYLLLKDKNQLAPLEKQIASYMKTGQVRSEARVEGSDFLTYHLEPFTKVHLYSSVTGLEPNGSITYLYVLGVVALLILSIASVNYTNLATAQSAGRTGEIGIRKVMGAKPGQLFMQYLGESGILSLIAVLIAVIVSILLLPAFNAMAAKQISVAYLLSPWALVAYMLLILIVSFMAGAYPAFILSRLRLIRILRAGFSFSSSGNGLRKSLIVFQFLVSIFLIICTAFILQQLHFIQNEKLGFDRDHILVLPVDRQMHRDYESIKKAIALCPQVKSVGGANGSPVFVAWTDGLQAGYGAKKKNITIKCIPADSDFVRTLGIHIAAGNGFTTADMFHLDTSEGYKNFRLSIILNETASRAMGWTPEEAVGKTVEKGARGVVKAVVSDFHIASFHEPIGPMLIFLDTTWINTMYIKVTGQDMPGTIAYLQRVWKEWVPYRPFEYNFLDEDYNALYKVETRTGKVFQVFALTAILLACLGLFAMAAFTTVQRTKEIGIRKVLGASSWNIASLLSSDFLKLVLFATLLAIPLSWWAVHSWLQDFAYRIHIQWWVFAATGLAVLAIALGTVSAQAIRAALANPVKNLRTE